MANPAALVHGPALVGIFLNVFLLGALLTQCFMYFTRFPNDRKFLKYLVVFLLVADTLSSIFSIWWIYDVLINHFGDDNALKTANWVFTTDPALLAIIALAVQLFFAWRVKVLTGNRWVVAFIAMSSLAACVGGIGEAIALRYTPVFADFLKTRSLVIVWLLCAAVSDVTITISLTWYLRRHKTGFTGTDDILNKIIRLTMQNGFTTAVWAIIDLALFLSSPSGIHLAFNFPLGKLYTNSLMSSLNSRAGWRFQSNESNTDKKSGDISGRRFADVVNLSTITRPEVFVTVESHEMVDDPKSRQEWSEESADGSGSKRPLEDV